MTASALMDKKKFFIEDESLIYNKEFYQKNYRGCVVTFYKVGVTCLSFLTSKGTGVPARLLAVYKINTHEEIGPS